MENKFYYNQKVFYAVKRTSELFEEIKSFQIKEIFTKESTIRLADPDLRTGVLFCSKTNEFTLMKFDNYYQKWEKSNWAFVAISLDESEVFKILAREIISEEKKEIEDLQKKIENSWGLITKAQKYL